MNHHFDNSKAVKKILVHLDAVFVKAKNPLWTSRILMSSLMHHNEYSENPISRTEIAPRFPPL